MLVQSLLQAAQQHALRTSAANDEADSSGLQLEVGRKGDKLVLLHPGVDCRFFRGPWMLEEVVIVRGARSRAETVC